MSLSKRNGIRRSSSSKEPNLGSGSSLVLDETARNKFLQSRLDKLNEDNSSVATFAQEEIPDGTLDDGSGRRALRRSDGDHEGAPVSKRKKTTKKSGYPRLTFAQLLADAKLDTLHGTPNYLTAAMGPSQYPPRKICTVCGFFSKYKCVRCGMLYCSIKCKGTHEETRCLKFTA
ncbi:hypothetical protein BC829DRAFT_379451 [Chytridium lagenaria]|nr:hypothetical protein BC829DRAFT_379451 [Chytridium lagenaria]